MDGPQAVRAEALDDQPAAEVTTAEVTAIEPARAVERPKDLAFDARVERGALDLQQQVLVMP